MSNKYLVPSCVYVFPISELSMLSFSPPRSASDNYTFDFAFLQKLLQFLFRDFLESTWCLHVCKPSLRPASALTPACREIDGGVTARAPPPRAQVPPPPGAHWSPLLHPGPPLAAAAVSQAAGRWYAEYFRIYCTIPGTLQLSSRFCTATLGNRVAH